MKRKRFIHMVMAAGFQRNQAQQIAKEVANHGSYSALFRHYRLALALNPLNPAFQRLCKYFGYAAKSLFGAVEWRSLTAVGVDLSSGKDQSIEVCCCGDGDIVDDCREQVGGKYDA